MKYEEIFLLLSKYWQAKREKDQKELDELKEKLQKEFDKQNKYIEKLKLEFECPELFYQLSPKEYGIKLLKKRRKRK